MSVHQRMDELAQAAESGIPNPELLKRLSDVLAICVACHAGWQLKVSE
jgi:hypothetical protein